MFWIGLTVGIIALVIALQGVIDYIDYENAEEDEYETAYIVIYK